MQLIKCFNKFLHDTVNLLQGRLDELVGRVESIYSVPENEVSR